VVAERVERLGAIQVARRRLERPDADVVAAALLAEIRRLGPGALPWPEAEQAMRARVSFASEHGLSGLPDLSDAGLMAALDAWLAPRLGGIDRLADVVLDGACASLVGWEALRALDAFAPMRFETPAGTSHAIDYAADGGPDVAVRAQSLFGLSAHPMLAAGRVPLALTLTSPAGRPLAKTRDLAAFWAGAWRDVQREMKGRYPKHPWPDDPGSAKPTTRTKAADARHAGSSRSG
jgi:ATP-dependent helicase HrpB